MMPDWQKLTAYGGMLNAALYLAGCFTAGLVTSNGVAWRLAIATAGIVYLSYLVHLARPESLADRAMLIATIGFGAAAGLALLFWTPAPTPAWPEPFWRGGATGQLN